MLIKRLVLNKILSFKDCTVELGPLNVLIGPNAVGKSNLIEVVGLLQAAPSSLSAAIQRGGGARQWIWLGANGSPFAPASIKCELTLSVGWTPEPVAYELEFNADSNGGLAIFGERVETGDHSRAYLVRGHNQLALDLESVPGGVSTAAAPPGESALSQYKNPLDTTPVTAVGYHFSQIRIFREFRTGPQSQARYGISTSAPKDALLDGADNLALVLHELDFLGVHERIKAYLARFCERFQDVKVRVGEGVAKTFLSETGLSEMLSAIRMSDGTLKFLALLAALFHPKPPPLLCIEEPEAGLHPDAMRLVAEALVEASQTTQLIVTTHSEALVDALTDRPETVLVCERDPENGTQMRRLSREDLKDWLEHYTLGQLWRKGEIGGGRW